MARQTQLVIPSCALRNPDRQLLYASDLAIQVKCVYILGWKS